MKLDFIEIGTSDFRALAFVEELVGVSVEPVKEYFDRLPNRKGLRKYNVAISNEPGELLAYYVLRDMVDAMGLPQWLRGCNCLNDPHPSVIKFCKDNNVDLDVLTSTEVVEVMDLRGLFNSVRTDRVEFLKVDTEGHDCLIINHLFDLFDENFVHLPYIKKIQFESNNLSKRDEVEAIKERAQSYGYKSFKEVTRGNEDTILRK